ncbi:hypothetical protein E2C01_057840 [Portunus trituberculatus]|uniref:Uncharacterized protein n=1 Tax=Portunus trituberculatus TaxID=210409 RepID=A0A5B7H3R2_PORTR|nr:hypothetical protein [Portunus trituberculatus]
MKESDPLKRILQDVQASRSPTGAPKSPRSPSTSQYLPSVAEFYACLTPASTCQPNPTLTPEKVPTLSRGPKGTEGAGGGRGGGGGRRGGVAFIWSALKGHADD